jgi:hypothetical protein
VRNEEFHNLLSTHITIVLIKAIKLQENEFCDVCRKRGRLENFRNVDYINRRKKYLSEDRAWMEAYYKMTRK